MKPHAPLAARPSRPPLSAFVLALSLWVGWALISIPASRAQEEPEPKAQEPRNQGPAWFQVELVIFARRDGASHGEKWPRDLELRYPFNWVELKAPGAPKSWLPDWLEKSEINPGPAGIPGPKAPNEPRWTPLQVDLERRPYFRLAPDDRNLNGVVGALARNSGYRLLFHQAWRQPLKEDQSNPALLIAGGERFGRHRELEGSITLRLSRYLHLDTNLWLTEFEPNFGQSPLGWPELPLAPDEQGRSQLPADDDGFFSETQKQGGSAWDRFTQTSDPLVADQPLPGFMQEDYLPRRIVAMDQQRRMRSEELHYLDHPLFGVLIEIKPYERPNIASDEQKDQESSSPIN